MSSFYLGVIVCVVVGLLFVFFPWLRKQSNQADVAYSNKSLIRQRLQELTTEQQQGLLSDNDREQSEKELKLALLHEVTTSESQATSITSALVVGALLSITVGLGVYWYANQVERVQHWQVAQQQTSELGQRMLAGDENLTLQDMQTFALGLRTKLVNKPDDPVGWMLLGRVSGALNRIDSAIQAFEKSLQLDADNVGTMSSYAQALLMTGQEEQILQAKHVLFKILSLEPNNTNAMGVLAIVATELGDKALALENWQRLVAFIPATDPNYQAVKQRITQLEAQVSPSRSDIVAEAETVAKKVAVKVNVSEALMNKLPEEGFLFVFAQESSGQVKMPAAVVKMPLPTFPVTVELSNDNAMMANYTLSQLEQAKLVARVSKDGDVTISQGELQGELIVTLDNEQVTQELITIDREL